MKIFHFIYFGACLCLLFPSCKKKTDILVKVYNPRLNEFVPNATVILFENNFGISFGSTTKDISTATTNENGIAYFDNAKLKKSGKHEYHITLKDAWGLLNSDIYDTESSDGSINKGGTSILTIFDTDPDATFYVKYNNIFNPAQINDSLSVLITAISVSSTKHSINYKIGGDTVFKKSIVYNPVNLPYPTILSFNSINYKASKLIVKTTKYKLGVTSTMIDTVKIYPNKYNTININW